MAPQSRGSLLLCLTFAALLFNPANISGQGIGQGSSKRIDGKYKFMPIPYMNYDRSMGFSLGAVPLLMFNPSEKDTISPSSILSLHSAKFSATNQKEQKRGLRLRHLLSLKLVNIGNPLSFLPQFWTVHWASEPVSRLLEVQ